MSWNKSSNYGASNHSGKQKRKNKFVFVFALSCFLLGVIALSIYTLLSRSPIESASNEHTQKTKLISEATPSKVSEKISEQPSQTAEEIAQEKAMSEKLAVIKRRQQKLKEIRERDTRPEKLPPYHIFSHVSENKIAMLLAIEPGTMILVPPRFDERFEKDFIQSCKEPIVIKDDDSDYVKRLKQDMKDCKIELCARMQAGEKLGDILTESYRELQKLGRVRDEVLRMARREMRDNARSEADVITTIEAANKLLESRGVAPMKDSTILQKSFTRIAERNAAKAAATQD